MDMLSTVMCADCILKDGRLLGRFAVNMEGYTLTTTKSGSQATANGSNCRQVPVRLGA